MAGTHTSDDAQATDCTQPNACVDCGTVLDLAGTHTSDDAQATDCTQPNTCVDCGTVLDLAGTHDICEVVGCEECLICGECVVYTVTFIGFRGTVLATETVHRGKGATEPENDIDEFKLEGWDNDFSNITGDLNVTAIYSVVFTFDPNNGDDTFEIPVIVGGTVSRPDDPFRDGYTFIGWKAGEHDYNFGITQASWPLTLVAHYGHTVTFNYDNGDEPDERVVAIDSKLDMPEVPVKDGFDFGGWKIVDDEEFWNFEEMKVNSNIILEAVWIPVTRGFSLSDATIIETPSDIRDDSNGTDETETKDANDSNEDDPEQTDCEDPVQSDCEDVIDCKCDELNVA